MIELTTYKNYKEICEVMGWKVSAGNTKKAQIKDLDRYCNYEKQGNKFVITEIFKEPKPKEGNKGNNIYGEYLQQLILHELSKRPINKDGFSIYLSKNALYMQLHLINKNYNIARNSIDKFSRYMETPVSTCYDFFNNTSGKLIGNVERCLNKLQSKCLIHWEYRMGVKLNSGTNRLATDVEIRNILEIEEYILSEMKQESKRDIFLSGKWNEFNKKVCSLLKETTEIQYYYKMFYIITTNKFRKMLLNEDDLEMVQNEVNAIMIDSTIKTATKHREKLVERYTYNSFKKGEYLCTPDYESHKVALREQYISDTKKIANKLIEWDVLDLVMKDISNEKYMLIESIMDEFKTEDDDMPYIEDVMMELFGT